MTAACSASSGTQVTIDGPAGSHIDAGHNSGIDARPGVGVDARKTTDASVAPSSGISIIVEPNGNRGSELVTAINNATTSVYMTMYQIDNTNVINAMNARAHAGLDVQAILDGSSTNMSGNMAAYTSMHNAGVNVVWSNPTFTYTHEKTVIIDGSTAWIMTMNANTSSPEYNREYLAIDTDAADVTEATQIFTADHAMQSITPSGGLVVADTNAQSKLVALIASATTTLDIEVEEFSDLDSNGIVDAVAAAAHRGVTTRVVLADEEPFVTSAMTAITQVKGEGAHVVVSGPQSGEGTASNLYIHAKAIVVDCANGTCAKAFIGSENFSTGSVKYNRELGVIFDQASEVMKVETAINTDFGHGTAQ